MFTAIRGRSATYFSGSLGENNLGIENADLQCAARCTTTRVRATAFGYMSYIINPLTRVSVMFGTTSNQFADSQHARPADQLHAERQHDLRFGQLNETQSELNNFAVVALQGTNGGALDYQVALFTRYSRTQVQS